MEFHVKYQKSEEEAVQAIKTEKLTKYYGKKRGIIDVSLEVEYGAVMGFIGTDGAGIVTNAEITLKYLASGMILAVAGVAAAFLKYPKKDV